MKDFLIYIERNPLVFLIFLWTISGIVHHIIRAISGKKKESIIDLECKDEDEDY